MSPEKSTEEADFLLGQSNKLFLLFSRGLYKGTLAQDEDRGESHDLLTDYNSAFFAVT